MKTFEQLNDAELVALTDEEIENYTKLKKAENGIRILQRPEYPDLQTVPEKDAIVYKVCEYVFTDMNRAEELANAMNTSLKFTVGLQPRYVYNDAPQYVSGKDHESLVSVQQVPVYTQAVYNSIQDMLKSNDRMKESYARLEREFLDEESKAEELMQGIYDAITAAKSRLALFREYKNRIVDYLKLANGDCEIAWNFFDKAYAVEPSVKNLIMQSEEYQSAVESYINA